MTRGYNRLKTVAVSDVYCVVPEELRSIDAIWLKRCLLDICGQYALENPTPFQQKPLLGEMRDGTTELLVQMLKPLITVTSLHVTFELRNQEISVDVPVADAPLRALFIGRAIDSWETSGIENLGDIDPEHVLTAFRTPIAWMVVAQGYLPLPGSPDSAPEHRVLPRLKLVTQPPNFDFSRLRQQLWDSTSDDAMVQLLKGLHVKLWHSGTQDMERFLSRLGVPDRATELIRHVVEACPECCQFGRVPHRPKNGTELAGHFNDVVMCDLFYLWGQQFSLLIDEASRYKVAAELPTKDAKAIFTALLYHWIRYFGPPRSLRSDQEGGIRAESFALVCDRFSIHRQLAGSDDSGKHTQTGLPERHIQSLKLSCLKCERSVAKHNLPISKADIVAECAMAHFFFGVRWLHSMSSCARPESSWPLRSGY